MDGADWLLGGESRCEIIIMILCDGISCVMLGAICFWFVTMENHSGQWWWAQVTGCNLLFCGAKVHKIRINLRKKTSSSCFWQRGVKVQIKSMRFPCMNPISWKIKTSKVLLVSQRNLYEKAIISDWSPYFVIIWCDLVLCGAPSLMNYETFFFGYNTLCHSLEDYNINKHF